MVRVKALIKKAARSILYPFAGQIPGVIVVKEYTSLQEEAGKGKKALRTNVHSETRLLRSVPVPVDGNKHWKFQETAPGVVSHSEATFCATLSQAQVVDEHGTIVTRNFKLVTDFFSRDVDFKHSKHPLLQTIRFRKVKKLKGRSFLVAAPDSANNYFHWMTDAFPKLEIAAKAGIHLSSIDNFVVSNPNASFQKQTLKRAGIDPSKLVSLTGSPYVQCEELIATSPSSYAGNVSPWIIDFLRKTYASAIANSITNKKRLFITRRKSQKRRLLNEEDLFSQLSSLNFEKVYLEDLSVQEQVEIFSAAEMIIGVHGAGFTNLVFCNAGAKVVEIFAPTYVNQCYWTIASGLKLKYFYLIGEGEDDTTIEHHLIERDILLSADKIKALVSFVANEGVVNIQNNLSIKN